jgi:hypothetical protein
VIVSLVYLALQVRQNNQSLRTENYARALDRVAVMQAQLSQNGPLARFFARGVADARKLTAPERIQLTWALYESFGAFEFMFYAAQARALPEEVWARWSGTMAWWLSYPGVQDWWRHRPAPFGASFTAFVEELLRENPTNPEDLARWQRFVAGEAGAAGTSASAIG